MNVGELSRALLGYDDDFEVYVSLQDEHTCEVLREQLYDVEKDVTVFKHRDLDENITTERTETKIILSS